MANNLTTVRAQLIIEEIFAYSYIKCEAILYWYPHLDAWKCCFKTQFKYLHLEEYHRLDREALQCFDSFILTVQKIREYFAREFNYYFNAIWC